MNSDSWLYSRIIEEMVIKDDFDLYEDELPVFEIRSDTKLTLISTKRIFERTNKELTSLDLKSIDDVIYGNFKGTYNKPTLSKFRIVDIEGHAYDFQMETGKASLGLIYCLNTLRKLKSQ